MCKHFWGSVPRSAQAEIRTGRIPVTCLVNMLIFLLRLEDDIDVHGKRRLARRVRNACDVSSGRMSVDFSMVRVVVEQICGVAFTFEDMRGIRRSCGLPTEASGSSSQLIAVGAMPSRINAPGRPAPTVTTLVPAQTVAAAAAQGQTRSEAVLQVVAEGLDTSELALLLVKERERTATLGAQNQSLLKRQTRANESRAKDKRKYEELHASHTALVSITNLRPKKRVVSVYGGYNLALLKMKGHVSADAIVAIVGGGEHQGKAYPSSSRTGLL